MKDEFMKNIGVWGQRHYAYLKKHSPTVINVMRMNGTLEQYLRDLDLDAQEMFELLMKQYAEIEGITEQLKVDNQMEWNGSMNSIKSRVTNMVNAELIYCCEKAELRLRFFEKYSKLLDCSTIKCYNYVRYTIRRI